MERNQAANLGHQQITLHDINSMPDGIIIQFGTSTQFRKSKLEH